MVETVGKDSRDQEDLQDQKVSMQRYYTFFKNGGKYITLLSHY